MATMMGNENIRRLTYEQATEQRRLDVCAYHQGANVFVAYGNLNNVKFWRIGSEQWLDMNKDRDCWVSLGEYADHKLSLIPLFYVKTQSLKDYDHVPTPSLITYDGEEYCLKWILREPITARHLKLWQTLQTMLATRYCEDYQDCKERDKFIDRHKSEYAMLRVPGFLNTSTGQDTRVIFCSGLRYDVLEMAMKLELSKHEAERYRMVKSSTFGYQLKRTKPKKSEAPYVPVPFDETLATAMLNALGTHHSPRAADTFMYVQRKNVNKHDRKDRCFFYDSYSVSDLESFVRRKGITAYDFWASAGEYHWNFWKVKETTVIRTKDDKKYTEIRRQMPDREKWVDAIQLNFLVLDFTKSELDHIPTLEEAQVLIYKRCQECNLPKPSIIDTGDNGEVLELRWPWSNILENCGEREDFNLSYIKFPKFNILFDAMQERLFELFWDLGAEEKKLSVTTKLRVVGTPNTKMGNIVRVVSEADEIISHEEFRKRLEISLEAPKPKVAPCPSFEEECARAVKEAEDYEREMNGEKVEKQQPLTDDLSRLHPGSERWVCICTVNKSKGDCGEWRNYWTPANRVHEKLAELRREISDFDEYNVFVSQLEFFRTCRKVEDVAAFRACFVDIDGKITGKDLTAEEWRDFVLKYCREKGILTPSELVFSGNGVHVKYFFTRYMYRRDFPRWQKLEDKLFEMFKEIGADSKSTDGARVLRIEGTRNNKPDTKDRDVRVIFEGDSYTFEDFEREVEAFQIQVAESIQAMTPTKERKVQEPKTEKFSKTTEISNTSKTSAVKKEETKPTFGSWFLVFDEKMYGTTRSMHWQWVTKSNLYNHLQKIDKDRQVSCSVVERAQDKHSSKVRNLYLNYVILTKCPGETTEAKIANIMERCQDYRGREIVGPNKILEKGNMLILIWRYSISLPGKALSRWILTQECLNRHFQEWGACIDKAQSPKALLPVPGYGSVRTVYENKELTYLFDRIACDVLPFSQMEVNEYKATKKKTHSLHFEPLTQEYVTRREAEGRKSRFNPALKIFNDIVKLLRLRAANSENGEVPEGHRELCVFYALNFAILAGLLKQGDGKDFDELAQKLINHCGTSFISDCKPQTFITLKNDFVAGLPIYRAQKATLIETLGITEEEKLSMDILDQYVVRAKSNKTQPWEKLGISRAQYYRQRKLPVAPRVSPIVEKCIAILCVRQKNSAYYEGGSGMRRGVCLIQGKSGSITVFSKGLRGRNTLGEKEGLVSGNKERICRVGGESFRLIVANVEGVIWWGIVLEVVGELVVDKVLLVMASGGLERFETERPPPGWEGRMVLEVFPWNGV